MSTSKLKLWLQDLINFKDTSKSVNMSRLVVYTDGVFLLKISNNCINCSKSISRPCRTGKDLTQQSL